LSDKIGHELAVFREFVEAAGLDVADNSIEAREPPAPDIFCLLGGEPQFFELGRLLDQESPRLRLEALRLYPDLVPVDPMKFGLPERDILRQKLGKSYLTGGYPVELMLYYDWGPDAFLTCSTPPPTDLSLEFVNAVILPECGNTLGPFHRIWFFDRFRGSVLWSHP
jgi:hypothetical protein